MNNEPIAVFLFTLSGLMSWGLGLWFWFSLPSQSVARSSDIKEDFRRRHTGPWAGLR